MTEEFLPETVRVEEFWGTVSYELLHVCPDAAKQEIQYRTKVRCDYDLKKIEDYVLDGLKPLTWKDIPDGWKAYIYCYPYESVMNGMNDAWKFAMSNERKKLTKAYRKERT